MTGPLACPDLDLDAPVAGSDEGNDTSPGGRPPPADEAGIAETGSGQVDRYAKDIFPKSMSKAMTSGTSILTKDRFPRSVPKSATSGISILTRRGPATAPLSTFDKDIGWTEIEITIDSGACDTVLPSRMLQHIDIVPSEDSVKGLEYEVANGETLPNVGEKHCVMMTEDSLNAKLITFQCADIHKPLLSVSRCADLGYDCILGKTGGHLLDTETKEMIPLHRRGNLYVMRAWVRQAEMAPADFRRQP